MASDINICVRYITSSNFSQDLSDDEYYISFGQQSGTFLSVLYYIMLKSQAKIRPVWPNRSGILHKQQMKTQSPLTANTVGSVGGAVQLYFLLY